jgi:hypothetical protein
LPQLLPRQQLYLQPLLTSENPVMSSLLPVILVPRNVVAIPVLPRSVAAILALRNVVAIPVLPRSVVAILAPLKSANNLAQRY